ncbi:MAG: hypothetical protein CLLPBCKN_007639 [Chroococcidiopsis cubana SAG 39.79]|uniref:Uncharacterized protein n=1 Tax=Chroococcidiopsis cubana SAG 39.79 TaxID=388085 RepID=A0AB37UT66_9CYAN|nr:hypothetical protein [Chroococcidiopsis cubana]MDZ4878204.1 hypothetical protein [Chroococcidiopsis cubana SAG 39.79]PSB66577.1 hypothetical protein C7B79_00545 [Chroococcidiopsis cubana CCALA 043]RUT14535.1 hypothetical protein DSM107010_00810 [Chroococcidiopsis cubana SAG 39.79]
MSAKGSANKLDLFLSKLEDLICWSLFGILLVVAAHALLLSQIAACYYAATAVLIFPRTPLQSHLRVALVVLAFIIGIVFGLI